MTMRVLLLLALFPGTILQMHAEEEKEAGNWVTLDTCRLVNSPLNEGDTLLVRHGDEQYTFRTYWVDAPESTDRDLRQLSEQGQYFSITEEGITDAGQLAKRQTQDFLRGEFTVHTRWEDARSDSNPSYFAIIEQDGEYLSQNLVARGLARIYGMPTEGKWPNGLSPGPYLSRLKNSERQAQREKKGVWGIAAGSMQMSGLETLLTSSEAGGAALTLGSPDTTGLTLAKKININKASLEELETLPGIGPALGQRIISARPIELIESLVEIPGISANTLAGFSHMIVTVDPPPPDKTIAFYRADLERYLDEEVRVIVAQAHPLEIESPEGFRALKLETAYNGKSGGTITTYIPDEFYDSFIKFYAEPGKAFTGLLYRQGEEVVLVYRRK